MKSLAKLILLALLVSMSSCSSDDNQIEPSYAIIDGKEFSITFDPENTLTRETVTSSINGGSYFYTFFVLNGLLGDTDDTIRIRLELYHDDESLNGIYVPYDSVDPAPRFWSDESITLNIACDETDDIDGESCGYFVDNLPSGTIEVSQLSVNRFTFNIDVTTSSGKVIKIYINETIALDE